ncbi:MAG TPA: hypothetical protein DCZ08_10890, partial [Anaerolineaceae bacterium]|nr:hypothetical protein [Anaerolineaceae bacterium]
VTVAGMVTRFRSHQTKKGDMMGFVTLEDVQGVVELVVFPRAWAQYAGLVVMDRVLQADGSLDNESGDPKVLVDRLTEVFLDAEGQTTGREVDPYLSYLPDEENNLPADELDLAIQNHAPEISRPSERHEPAKRMEWDDMPPPPEFPDDWHLLSAGAFDSGSIQPDQAEHMVVQPVAPVTEEAAPAMPQPVSEKSAAVTEAATLPIKPPPVKISEPLVHYPPMNYLVAPVLSSEVSPGEIRMVKVILRSTGDKHRDVLRVRRVHGVLRSAPGRDKFALMVFEGGSRYLMEFPNETTGISTELLRTLTAMVGEGSVLVETIKLL